MMSQQVQNTASGFAIQNIILTESTFTRINNAVFEGVDNTMNINVNVSVKSPTITVEETVDLVQTYQGKEQMKIRVKMVGIFQMVGESQIKDLESFGRINGAAIIFPYIREHITNLSQKGGMGTIILPPVNFTKIDNNNAPRQ